MRKVKDFVGETIGYLTILDEYYTTDDKGKRIRMHTCLCSACGKTVERTHKVINMAKYHEVIEGKKPSCGCLKYSGFMNYMDETLEDLIGKTYNSLTVIDHGPTISVGKTNKRRRTWKCKCSCGAITYVQTGDLISGNTKTCGCSISIYQNEIAGILMAQNIEYKKEYTFDDLLSPSGSRLRFDFAILDHESLVCLIEYQGAQHYIGDTWFGKLEREVTDAQKVQYCLDRSIPLFEITYKENIQTRMHEILQFVHDNTVPSPQATVA